MAIPKAAMNHKHEIFTQARQLMRRQGYHRTSIADIANACSLSKASIYHHISEKKDLVNLAINEVRTFFKENCFDHLLSKPLSSRQKIDLLFETLDQYLNEHQGGCLVHNLVHELVDSEPEFLESFQEYFALWLEVLADILKPHYVADKAKSLAEDLLAQLAGAIMLDRLYHTSRHVARIKALLLSYTAEKALAGVD